MGVFIARGLHLLGALILGNSHMVYTCFLKGSLCPYFGSGDLERGLL